MPNWCTNRLEVSGLQSDIDDFRERARGRPANYNSFYTGEESWEAFDGIRKRALVQTPAPLDDNEVEFCFNALHPVPVDFRRFAFDDNSAKKMGEDVGEERAYGGYTWQNSNWGTKWDVGDVYIESDDSWWCAEFDTAWGPLVSFLEKVSADFPNLNFTLTFYESGMGFAGRVEFCDGELASEEELPIEDFVDYDDYDDYGDDDDGDFVPDSVGGSATDKP